MGAGLVGALANAVALGFMPGTMAFAVGLLAKGAAKASAQARLGPDSRRAEAWARGAGAENWREFLRQCRDPASREALVASLRAAMDGMDDAVADRAGVLGRLYASEGRGPDRFFRSCVAALSAMDAQDLSGARELLRGVAQMLERQDPDGTYEGTVSMRSSGEGTPVAVSVWRGVLGKALDEGTRVPVMQSERVLALVSQALTGWSSDLPEADARDVRRLIATFFEPA